MKKEKLRNTRILLRHFLGQVLFGQYCKVGERQIKGEIHTKKIAFLHLYNDCIDTEAINLIHDKLNEVIEKLNNLIKEDE